MLPAVFDVRSSRAFCFPTSCFFFNNCQTWPTREGKGLSRPRDKHASDAPISTSEFRAMLAVYWAFMVLVVVCLREHQRRTEGVFLRRVKTFCLAGTFIFVLKMTQKLTQVGAKEAKGRRKSRRRCSHGYLIVCVRVEGYDMMVFHLRTCSRRNHERNEKKKIKC